MILVNDPDFKLMVGDVLEQLALLPDESVHCVVTSPPYWGLRDYGTGSWDGGDPDCDHVQRQTRGDAGRPATMVARGVGGALIPSGSSEPVATPMHYRDVCGKCGATRVDQQLGLEATPELFVASMVAVFREVRRVLRRDGTCWVNLGDSYNSGTTAQRKNTGGGGDHGHWQQAGSMGDGRLNFPGLKTKDLCGLPWRVAFALQADGWYLRSDIVWSKPNPMPESVTDRPTKAHEYVFLLTRSPRYYFDADAVREPHTAPERNGKRNTGWDFGGYNAGNSEHVLNYHPAGRNVRSVWEIATQPYPDAHFATFPEELPRRCILAGTSERGCCPVCGAPWERETETTRELEAGRKSLGIGYKTTGIGPVEGVTKLHHTLTRETLGWRPTCLCAGDALPATHKSASDLHETPTTSDELAGGVSLAETQPRHNPILPNVSNADSHEPVPCTVLDPFMGSGTTALVARKHGRRSIGIELNPDYAALCARRLQQLSLFAGDPA